MVLGSREARLSGRVPELGAKQPFATVGGHRRCYESHALARQCYLPLPQRCLSGKEAGGSVRTELRALAPSEHRLPVRRVEFITASLPGDVASRRERQMI